MSQTFKEYLIEGAKSGSSVPDKLKNGVNKLLNADIDAFDIIEALIITQTAFEEYKEESKDIAKNNNVDPESSKYKKGDPVKELLNDVKADVQEVLTQYFKVAKDETRKMTPTQLSRIVYMTLVEGVINSFKDSKDVKSILAGFPKVINEVLRYIKDSDVEIANAEDAYVKRNVIIRDISANKKVRGQAKEISILRDKAQKKADKKATRKKKVK